MIGGGERQPTPENGLSNKKIKNPRIRIKFRPFLRLKWRKGRNFNNRTFEHPFQSVENKKSVKSDNYLNK
jgi:hypothetical protein